MSRLRRWRSLSREERRLTVQAWLLLLVAVVRIRSRPDPAHMGDGMQLFASRAPHPPGSVDAAVRRAARYAPSAKCLAQAIAARVMLSGSGDPQVRYSVAREPGGGLLAHAWVEMGGTRVAGDPPAPGSMPLTATER